ncbi:hypothetical protein QZH41_010045, partial [Actinostola sp. cb2023]
MDDETRESSMPSASISSHDRIVLNIGGSRFELLWCLVESMHLTRLEKLHKCLTMGSGWENFCDGYDKGKDEFFFQRDPVVFNNVMNFYLTGKIHIPRTVCVEYFQSEIEYWGISLKDVDECCHHHYQQEVEVVDNMRKIKSVFQRNIALAMSCDRKLSIKPQATWPRLRQSVWDLFENPKSSQAAKVVSFTSTFFVILSTVALCLNTIPNLRVQQGNGKTGDNPYLAIVEAICIAWFTFEYMTRLVSSPKKLPFLKNMMNTIDLLAILPYFTTLVFEAFDNEVDDRLIDIRRLVQILRILRIVRIFKMARHSIGLQTLAYTLKHSSAELGLLVLLLLMGMTLFSSLVYFAEETEPSSHFKSIPEGFWWAIITMTTVGYGDMYPITPLGKVIGCICCTSGIIFIALPIPTIVGNFSQFYKDQRKNDEVLRRLSRVEDGLISMYTNVGDLSFDSNEPIDNKSGVVP